VSRERSDSFNDWITRVIHCESCSRVPTSNETTVNNSLLLVQLTHIPVNESGWGATNELD
jgi:hypothetical protein